MKVKDYMLTDHELEERIKLIDELIQNFQKVKQKKLKEKYKNGFSTGRFNWLVKKSRELYLDDLFFLRYNSENIVFDCNSAIGILEDYLNDLKDIK